VSGAFSSIFSNMSALEKLLYILDLLASFILTRFPYVCILTLLLQAGQRNIKQPHTWFEVMFEPTYVHAMIYFICGGGMTVETTRKAAGFGAAVHTGYFAVKTLVKPHVTEWLMVSVLKLCFMLAPPLNSQWKSIILNVFRGEQTSSETIIWHL
jgi:hypothetical protein